MSNILVTGINGFVGKHLARELSHQGHTVFGIGQAENNPADEIAHLVAEYKQCDITDPAQVKQLPLMGIDAIINLAGLANVGASFDNPELYMQVNVAALTVLGDEFYKVNPSGRIIAISTGAVYESNQPMPLSEVSETVSNASPYAQSKLKMEESGLNFAQQGFDCIIVRPFNHIGPGQAPGFLVPDLYEKLARFKSHNETVRVGNLSTSRDYTDVRDIAKAYVSLVTAEKLSHVVYNACSSIGASGEEILSKLCLAMNLNRENIVIEVDDSLIRPNDPIKILGDHSRLTKDTRWTPSISLESTLEDIVASKT